MAGERPEFFGELEVPATGASTRNEVPELLHLTIILIPADDVVRSLLGRRLPLLNLIYGSLGAADRALNARMLI